MPVQILFAHAGAEDERADIRPETEAQPAEIVRGAGPLELRPEHDQRARRTCESQCIENTRRRGAAVSDTGAGLLSFANPPLSR